MRKPLDPNKDISFQDFVGLPSGYRSPTPSRSPAIEEEESAPAGDSGEEDALAEQMGVRPATENDKANYNADMDPTEGLYADKMRFADDGDGSAPGSEPGGALGVDKKGPTYSVDLNSPEFRPDSGDGDDAASIYAEKMRHAPGRSWWAKIGGALSSSIDGATYKKQFIDEPYEKQAAAESVAEAGQRRRAAEDKQTGRNDPTSLYSRYRRYQLRSQLNAQKALAARHGMSDMSASADDMLRSLDSLSGAQLDTIMGSTPPGADGLGSAMKKGRSTKRGPDGWGELDYMDEEDAKDDDRAAKGRSRNLGDMVKQDSMMGRWAREVHSDAGVKEDNKIVRITGQALHSMDNPKAIYTPQFHSELNQAYARALSGGGAVLPVMREKLIRMNSAMEWLGRKIQGTTGIPMNSIPSGFKNQLRQGLERLHDFNVKNRYDRVQQAVSGKNYENYGDNGTKSKKKVLQAYDPASAPDVYRKPVQAAGASAWSNDDEKRLQQLELDFKAKAKAGK